MKKIICICIFLSSGCGKLLSHGRPANDVVDNTGSEAPPPLPSNTPVPEPSNTPAPTPEPSKSAPPSDSADTGSSVGKYAVNTALCVVALALVIVGGYDVFRFFKPKEVIIPVPNPLGGDMEFSFYKANSRFYKLCYLDCVDDISYTWYLARSKAIRYFWFHWDCASGKTEKIDSKITVYKLVNSFYGSYVCGLSPDQ